MNCNYCGKKITGSEIKHVNIGQSNKVRNFCSKSCKKSWCFEICKTKNKTAIMWALGKYSTQFFFVKKVISLKSKSFLIELKNRSFFSKDLRQYETLELSKREDGNLFLKVKKLI